MLNSASPAATTPRARIASCCGRTRGVPPSGGRGKLHLLSDPSTATTFRAFSDPTSEIGSVQPDGGRLDRPGRLQRSRRRGVWTSPEVSCARRCGRPQRNKEKARVCGRFFSSGGRIRTCDLRSPADLGRIGVRAHLRCLESAEVISEQNRWVETGLKLRVSSGNAANTRRRQCNVCFGASIMATKEAGSSRGLTLRELSESSGLSITYLPSPI
jgi:hypothetical protein